jgi:phosphinothricin acetyltransferase
MDSGMTIRTATAADAEALIAIYAPYVRETAITYECEVPTEAEFAKRISTTLQKYPYLVAEREGVPVGYAYAGPFKGRAAYDWSAEVSIYVERGSQGCGVGRALYTALERALQAMGIRSLYACIATPDEEDCHLTFGSARFHERMGYSSVGTFRHCASKFGRWYNATWMEKPVGDREAPPVPIIWYPEASGPAQA